MTETAPNRAKAGRMVLKILPLVLVPAVFLASAPWLKATIGGLLVSWIAVPVAIFVMAYANYLGFRSQRGLDEVQVASGRFAAQWGVPAGQAAFVLLLMLPPFQHFVTDVVLAFGGPGPGMTIDRSVVVFAMTLGFCGLVLAQAIGTVVVNLFWWRANA